MHEAKLATKICEEAKKLGAAKAICLEVGELAVITAEEIYEALVHIVPWEITIKSKESRIRCYCGYEGVAQILEREHDFCLFQCPSCGNRKPDILEGGEIKIIGVG